MPDATHPLQGSSTGSMLAVSPTMIERHFGGAEDLLPLWVAEPYLPLAPAIVSAVCKRATEGWYGYETRPEKVLDAFWGWMHRRHRWSGAGLSTSFSPSVGTSIGAIIDMVTEPGDGVIIQPPVFTDFKPLVRRHSREPIRNPLVLQHGRYTMDFGRLKEVASAAANKAMIVCNPHNPVGRAWTVEEMRQVAEICDANDVVVVADEIHADVVLPEFRFTPFAEAASSSGVRWAATHGPIKTFGIAGLADTLLITDDAAITKEFRSLSARLHLTRNNVISIAATEAGYRLGDDWVDDLVELVSSNLQLLSEGLPEGIDLVDSEATYLAWLDFRNLGMDVPELSSWLSTRARIALSPGHWFGREGAGFARMSIAVDSEVVEEAVGRLRSAVAEYPTSGRGR